MRRIGVELVEGDISDAGDVLRAAHGAEYGHVLQFAAAD
ncbi:hypothetical protein [Mycobacterium asiaticum]